MPGEAYIALLEALDLAGDINWYASHSIGCALYQRSYALGIPDCSCGLDKLRDELAGQKRLAADISEGWTDLGKQWLADGAPVGAEFEAVWDANTATLFEEDHYLKIDRAVSSLINVKISVTEASPYSPTQYARDVVSVDRSDTTHQPTEMGIAGGGKEA